MPRALVLVFGAALLVGCASTYNAELYSLASTRRQRTQIAPAARCETKPWAAGQWVLYQTTSHGRIIAFDRIRVGAQNGLWLEWIEDTATTRTTWLIGVREEPDERGVTTRHVAAILRDGAELWTFERGSRMPSKIREALDANAAKLRLHLNPLVAPCTAETVDVPAGRFADATRMAHDPFVAWLHPSVPLGGVVKMRIQSAHLERALVAYGESDPARLQSDLDAVIRRARHRCPADPRACELPVRTFLSVGFGIGRWTEAPGVATRGGPLATLQLGQRVGQGLHIVEEATFTYGGNADLEESHTALMLGLRWTPFRRGRRAFRQAFPPTPFDSYDVDALHLKLGVGAMHRYRRFDATDSKDEEWAPAASAALGWLPLQGTAWAFGIELRYQIERANDGWQREWTFAWLAQLSD